MKTTMTLKESLENDRIQIVHLIWIDGQFIGNFTKEEAIKQFGDKKYSAGYSEGNGKVDIWIY